MDLNNETVVNVAGLLQEPLGSFRSYPLRLDALLLDNDGLTAEDIHGRIKLTRLTDEIMANIRVKGDVELECLRCLRAYAQPFTADFTEEFRIAHDVRTGAGIDAADDDERFTIDENHELDFREALRQEILVSLPMRPTCVSNCPGPYILETKDEDDEEPVDNRFAALAKLLDADG